MRYLLFILLFTFGLNAQQLAFNGAIGAGAEFNDWSNATILHVTSLADTDQNNVGTLRWALLHPDNRGLDRIIVFDVSGVIDLQSRFRGFTSDNPDFTGSVYVAGQTAPQGGITVIGDLLQLSGYNIVFRYVKFRSDDLQSTDTMLGAGRGDYSIIDHCSFAYHSPSSSTVSMGARETSVEADWTRGTFSNNLMSQNTLGFIAGSSGAPTNVGMFLTVTRNAYYNISHRVPLKGSTKMRADVVNNIVHNWSSRTIRMDGYQYNLNHFKNYYQAGGNTTNTLKWSSYLSSTGDPQIFTENNFLEDDPRGTYSVPAGYDTDESVAWTEFQNNFVALPSSYFTNTQHALQNPNYTIYPNAQLIDSILPDVGANKYIDNNGVFQFERDIYDQEAIDGIINNSSSTRNTDTTFPLTHDSNTRPGGFYGVNQHIPTAWLTANGYSDTVNVHSLVEADGYTILEHYINQVDGDYTPPATVDVTGVTVTPSTTSINIGQTTTLTETISPVNATDQTGVWASSNGSVATVDQSGRVTGVSVGSSTISFTANDTAGGVFTDTCVVTVSEAPVSGGGDGGLKLSKKLIIINN